MAITPPARRRRSRRCSSSPCCSGCSTPPAILGVGLVAARPGQRLADRGRRQGRRLQPARPGRRGTAVVPGPPLGRPTTAATPAAGPTSAPAPRTSPPACSERRSRAARGQPGRPGDHPAGRAHGIRQRSRPAHLAGVRRLPGAPGRAGARDDACSRCRPLVADAHPAGRPSASSAQHRVNVTELNVALETARRRRPAVSENGPMARGRLRIYLGAAPGVGKTVAMLDEGRRRLARGTDVVVGLRRDPRARAHRGDGRRASRSLPRAQLELPRRDLRGDGPRRACSPAAPTVALVDELAHTNVPGSRHEKRWQDIDELLDAGIDVISTVNIQHLESLNDVVESITGVVQRETVPDEVVRRADQIELVDMSPEALRRRMAHGNIYKAEKVDAALANYFRVGNLVGAARAGPALARRPRRRGAGAVPRRPRHRLARGRPASGSSSPCPAAPRARPCCARGAGSPRAAPAASCSPSTSPAPTASSGPPLPAPWPRLRRLTESSAARGTR